MNLSGEKSNHGTWKIVLGLVATFALLTVIWLFVRVWVFAYFFGFFMQGSQTTSEQVEARSGAPTQRLQVDQDERNGQTRAADLAKRQAFPSSSAR